MLHILLAYICVSNLSVTSYTTSLAFLLTPSLSTTAPQQRHASSTWSLLWQLSSPAKRSIEPTTTTQPNWQYHEVPPYLNDLAVGESVYIDNGGDINLQITKVSNHPPIFHLPRFLSYTDCETLMSSATSLLHDAQTRQGIVEHRAGSQVAWLGDVDHHEDDDKNSHTGSAADDTAHRLAGYLQHVTAHLFLPMAPSVDAERLQVVRYEPSGRYDLHHDGFDRTVTVLTYLNGIAGTWFPFCTTPSDTHNDDFENTDKMMMMIPTMQLGNKNMVQGRTPGRDGICFVGNNEELAAAVDDYNHVVRIAAGDAISFYNYQKCDHHADKQIEIIMAWKTLHCGLSAPATKWIATNWLTAIQDEVEDLENRIFDT
jgi:hypothetical protein